MNTIYEDLVTLSRTLDSIRPDQAERVLQNIANWIKRLLGANQVDVFWSEATDKGVVLRPFVSTKVGQTLYQIPGSMKPEATWDAVYLGGEPIWLQGIDRHLADNSTPTNKMNNQPIDAAWLKHWPEAVDIAIIPLIHYRETKGLVSVEVREPNVLSAEHVDLLSALNLPFANVIAKSHMQVENETDTRNAVDAFLTRFGNAEDEDLLSMHRFRTAFIAIPFDDKFASLGPLLRTTLSTLNVRASIYNRDSGGREVIGEIKRQIRDAHIGIADVTGARSNVLCEVGMMMMLDYPVFLLRRHGTKAKLPFDLNTLQLHEYRIPDAGKAGVAAPEVEVRRPGTGAWEPIAKSLAEFCAKVERNEKRFQVARKWVGEGQKVAAPGEVRPEVPLVERAERSS